MELSERKKRILKAIVNEYIDTAEPVGSGTIANKYDNSFSTATIRNEMAELEGLGFLDKPHTSAGRIPSSKGYRWYVNNVLPDYEPMFDEELFIRSVLSKKLRDFDEIIAEASKLVSKLTNYMVIASDCFEDSLNKRVYTDGVVNIFNHPEYRNVEKAKKLIGFIDCRDSVYDIISNFNGEKSIKITIGDENSYEDLKDCSVVVSHYYDRGERKGGIGIIGPTRMDYRKVVSSLDVVTDILSKLIAGQD